MGKLRAAGPGADRKGNVEGGSCLPSLSQFGLLGMGALRGGRHYAAGGGIVGFGEKWEELPGWGRTSPKNRLRCVLR